MEVDKAGRQSAKKSEKQQVPADFWNIGALWGGEVLSPAPVQRSLPFLSGFLPTAPAVISLPVRLILFQMAERRPVEASA